MWDMSDPISAAGQIIDKKARNLEKRKVRLSKDHIYGHSLLQHNTPSFTGRPSSENMVSKDVAYVRLCYHDDM